MQLLEILDELNSYSNEGIKKIIKNHGAKEPLFGVKVEDLKKDRQKKKGERLNADFFVL